MSEYDHRLALAPGYRFAEYIITRVLGQGGFGITYLARDTLLNVDVAIKELLPRDSATRVDGVSVVPKRPSDTESFTWAKDRFISEARILASLRHENIVHVNRFLEINGTAYMIMEFVQGQNLSEWLRSHRKLTEADLKAILLPLLDGLEAVHRKNVLHRDISPENILMTADHRPMLLDFGSARTTDKSRKLTGVVRPGYSPIEQYQTDEPQGPYTDIYALAGVMIYAITGQAPPLSMDRCGSVDSYQPLAKRYRGKYDAGFLRAIDEAFSIAPQNRPQSVAEWRQRLTGDSGRVKEKVKLPPPKEESKRRDSKRVVPIERKPKKTKGVVWMMAVAALGLIAAGVSLYYVMNGGSGGGDTSKSDGNTTPLVGSGDSKPSKTFDANSPYTNSLGMKFVPVPGTKVLFCIHQTRRKDYAAFADAHRDISSEWKHASKSNAPVGDQPDDPVVMVSWNEANAFCQWLSEVDSRDTGSMIKYGLPTWDSWRIARGSDKYPWGNEESPPKGAGNFADLAAQKAFGANFPITPGYDDGFPTTSPWRSFKPNRFGLYDLGSNVQEWSSDRDISSQEMFVLGASWKDLATSSVAREKPEYHESADSQKLFIGFRCVLVPP